MKTVLKPDGVITMEFPHLMRLMNENQFDTIYHEHFSYFSFIASEKIFARHGFRLFDVEELPTHGGSLRIYGRHEEDNAKPIGARVIEMRKRELDAGFGRIETYRNFGEQVKETKRKLLEFLIGARREGKSIVGYGAPGKGNTLLNYCGIRTQSLQAGQVSARNAHSDPASRQDQGDQARLFVHLAVEFQGRDHGADVRHSGMGGQVRRADSRSDRLSLSRPKTCRRSRRVRTTGEGALNGKITMVHR
jgi:hypothetical protein